MKKFNLLQEIVAVNKAQLNAAVNAANPFGITIHGAIHHPPFDAKACYVFQGSVVPPAASSILPAKSPNLSDLLGGTLQITDTGESVLLKCGRDWQNIIRINLPNADYDDTTGDGIAEFTDTQLEEIGWQATEFGISYRELVDRIEAHCDGTLLCIENEGEHYQFSGMGFIADLACARKQCFDHCVQTIGKMIAHDENYAASELTDDEEEALAFFAITPPR